MRFILFLFFCVSRRLLDGLGAGAATSYYSVDGTKAYTWSRYVNRLFTLRVLWRPLNRISLFADFLFFVWSLFVPLLHQIIPEYRSLFPSPSAPTHSGITILGTIARLETVAAFRRVVFVWKMV